MQLLSNVVICDVKGDQLGNEKVDVGFRKTEELVAQIVQHPRLLGLVKVSYGHRGVEELGLEESQDPGRSSVGCAATVALQGPGAWGRRG